MSDIKLFKINNGVAELPATWVSVERELQTLIESNMLEIERLISWPWVMILLKINESSMELLRK
jgi:hypothetical protein